MNNPPNAARGPRTDEAGNVIPALDPGGRMPGGQVLERPPAGKRAAIDPQTGKPLLDAAGTPVWEDDPTAAQAVENPATATTEPARAVPPPLPARASEKAEHRNEHADGRRVKIEK